MIFVQMTHENFGHTRRINANGHEVFEDLTISKDALIQEIKNYDALVVRSKFFIDEEIINAMRKDFIVMRAGAGMDNINEEYAKQKGIKLINAPEGNRTAVAEHVVGMLLTLLRNIHIANSEIRQKVWHREENRGYELKGRTVGIIGYGNTGKELAKKLSGFEVNVIAYDKYLSNITR